MKVIGADGVHVGTVDKVERGRIKLTKRTAGLSQGPSCFTDKALVTVVEGDKVRLSATRWRRIAPCSFLENRTESEREQSSLSSESLMDNEKKPEKTTAEQPKQDVGQIVGDLVVSGATVLANTAAQAVVDKVRKAAAKSPPVRAAAKAVKKAKKSIATSKVTKSRKAKKAPKKSGAKSSGGKAGKKSKKKSGKKSNR